MIQLVSAAEAATRRYFMDLPNGIGTWVTSYMGITAAEARARKLRAMADDIATTSPVAYLVEQPAESKIAGHFHQVDQFQVFLAGDGTFGSKTLDGVHVHYAAAYTPYAPITAAREPLRYFTLRPGFDPGAQWMPESKAKLLAEKREFRSEVAELQLHDHEQRRASIENVIAADITGLGAWLYHLGPDGRADTVSPERGGGQFLLVLRGECGVGGLQAAEHSIAHIDTDDDATTLVAGPDGAEVLLVQFARHESR